MHLLLPNDAVLSVRRTTRKNSIALKVTHERNTLLVPRQYSDRKIERFIAQQLLWIEQSIQQQRARLPNLASMDTGLSAVWRFGESFQIHYIDSETLVWDAITKQVLLPKSHENHPGLVKKKLQTALLAEVSAWLLQETHRWAHTMNLHDRLGAITVKNYKSRWGSCRPDGSLQFNWRLAFFAPEVIEYVVIHELAHLQHANHGSDFWAMVELYCPDYKRHRLTLKQNTAKAMAF